MVLVPSFPSFLVVTCAEGGRAVNWWGDSAAFKHVAAVACFAAAQHSSISHQTLNIGSLSRTYEIKELILLCVRLCLSPEIPLIQSIIDPFAPESGNYRL
jgi:hypothetical protein